MFRLIIKSQCLGLLWYSCCLNAFFLKPDDDLHRSGQWLVLQTSDYEVLGSNSAGGGIHLMTVWHFVAHSLSLSPYHCLDMT